MRYWIFVASNQMSNGVKIAGRETLQRRFEDGFWGLGERTPNRKNVAKGDRVVFYLARPESAFAGEAQLASECIALDPDTQERLAHGMAFYHAEYGVYLSSPQEWDEPRPAARLATELEFIEDPAQWGVYLQGGVREISEADYQQIVTGLQTKTPPEELERSLFALESHLEEFIEKNWHVIDWNSDLRLFVNGEQSGRQFPAGKWSIDFLAVDNKTNDLVVIELKRGQTSDATIGQVLRYIGWVQENVAEANQEVRGIVVAKEIDDSLQYAAANLPNVDLKTYSVSFELN